MKTIYLLYLAKKERAAEKENHEYSLNENSIEEMQNVENEELSQNTSNKKKKIKKFSKYFSSRLANSMMDSDSFLLNESENVSIDSIYLLPSLTRKVFFEVGETRSDLGQLQISILSSTSTLLWGVDISGMKVIVTKIRPDNYLILEKSKADCVEITIKDQHSLRSDLYRLWDGLKGHFLHCGQTVSLNNILKATVRKIYKNGRVVASSFVSPTTQPVFRSESARYIILLQLSAETREFEDDGELMSSKIISFLVELFSRWESYRINHLVTIIMFSRVIYDSNEASYFKNPQWLPDLNAYFCDYYKVIVDMESRQNWLNIIPLISRELKKYFKDILEVQLPSEKRMVVGKICRARYGNVLEAINLSLNSFASNADNRDLLRSGRSILVVTPSNGIFNAPKRLLRITTERMLKIGQSVDLVCLSHYPLFQPPVFCYKGPIVPTEKELLVLLKNRKDLGSIYDTSSPFSKLRALLKKDISTLSPSHAEEIESETNRSNVIDITKKIDPNSLDPLYYDEEKWCAFFCNDYSLTGNTSENKCYSKSCSDIDLAYSIDDNESISSKKIIDYEASNRAVLNQFNDKISTPVLSRDSNQVKKQIQGGVWQYPTNVNLKNIDEIAHIEVTYCFYPSWIYCGFYDVGIDNDKKISDFEPRFKMGKLNNTGVADFMKKLPEIEDIDLDTFGFPDGFKNLVNSFIKSKDQNEFSYGKSFDNNEELQDLIFKSCNDYDEMIFRNIVRQDRSLLPGENRIAIRSYIQLQKGLLGKSSQEQESTNANGKIIIQNEESQSILHLNHFEHGKSSSQNLPSKNHISRNSNLLQVKSSTGRLVKDNIQPNDYSTRDSNSLNSKLVNKLSKSRNSSRVSALFQGTDTVLGDRSSIKRVNDESIYTYKDKGSNYVIPADVNLMPESLHKVDENSQQMNRDSLLNQAHFSLLKTPYQNISDNSSINFKSFQLNKNKLSAEPSSNLDLYIPEPKIESKKTVSYLENGTSNLTGEKLIDFKHGNRANAPGLGKSDCVGSQMLSINSKEPGNYFFLHIPTFKPLNP
ncbi:Vacuolar membrane-associated protein IML1 [Smittium culicis]|uniref:Vacuolar membrane-associated protein IML1 n=1 Tax=Smittium culicis TaxID=133412 RepID=A0A1R1XEZ7_9FUNG|nr:Vacuolar membrane-associated protein IML1 [Smittium culicis]